MEIKDKVVIITGASRGIGLATARHLSELGAKIVLASRSADVIKRLESELPESLAVVTDMREPEDIKNLIDKTMEKYQRIDILINNAGQGMYGGVEHIEIEKYEEIMELNVYSIVRAMKLVIPIMRKQGKGMIVNISSGTSRMYLPYVGAYSSTKYALNAISFIARKELEKDGIIVSLVFPRITATKFAENAIGRRPDFSARLGGAPPIDPPERVAEKIEEIIKSEEAEISL
jgi:short-subunit dehydrogenase